MMRFFCRSVCAVLLLGMVIASAGAAAANGTLQRMTDLNTSAIAGTSCEAGDATPYGHTNAAGVYFMACTAPGNYGIYKINPQTGAASLVKGGFVGLGMPFALGGKIYFNAGYGGRELWVSNGTALGTIKLATFADHEPFQLVGSHNLMYFLGDDAHGREVWATNGTVAGTSRVTTLQGHADQLVNVAGTLYFTEDGATDRLWKIDETGISIVADNLAAVPANLIAAGSALYFRGFTAADGWEVWKSVINPNGTTTTTQVTTLSGAQSPQNLTYVGDGFATSAVFFTAAGSLYHSVYRINAAGVSAVQHFALAYTLRNLTNVQGRLFLAVNETRLWTIDQAGSRMVKDLGHPINFLQAGGARLYFKADGNGTVEAWQSDGTALGTVKFSQNLKVHYSTNTLLAADGVVYLTASDGSQLQGQHGQELWRYVP